MQKNSRISFIKFIFIIYVIILIFLSLSYTLLLMKKSGSNSDEIENYGQKYGNTQFIKYQGKISIPVPSGGRYFLEKVDIDSFKVLDSQDYSDRSTLIVGLDKNSVYFGNIRIPDLDPNKLEVLGNGYYTDGINTYYCSDMSERNKNLSSPMEIFQTSIYAFSKTKRPQSYIYPYKKVETDKRLKAVDNLLFCATDGDNVYYKGEILNNADLNTLEIIDKSTEYFADKENVYYKSNLLPIKNSGKLKIVSSEHGDKFLYDEVNGYVFIEDYSFDREKAPYKVIGNNGTTLYNLIFIAKDGIYYYDNQKKQQLKAGDNIFIGNIEEITPNVFTDDENIYYFHAYDVSTATKKSIGELISKNTDICYLDKKEGWEKVADIKEASVASIWKKEDKYYYFNNLGIFPFMDNTIYEISDKETLNYLLSKADDKTDDIEELIKNEKLIAVSGEKKMTITVKYKTDIVDKIFKYFIRIFLVAYLIFFIFKEFRRKK